MLVQLEQQVHTYNQRTTGVARAVIPGSVWHDRSKTLEAISRMTADTQRQERGIVRSGQSTSPLFNSVAAVIVAAVHAIARSCSTVATQSGGYLSNQHTWANASVEGSKRAASAAGMQLSLDISGRLLRSTLVLLLLLGGDAWQELSVDERMMRSRSSGSLSFSGAAAVCSTDSRAMVMFE